MKTVVEPLEGNKVKLSIEVGSAEVDKAVDAAARKLAREVRMKGFRPGKVPRQVLEARMGHEALRQEALRESLPDYYAEAVREHEVDVIAPPAIDITAGEDAGDLHFDAVVEVRPSVAIPGYAGLQVTIDRPGASDEEIDAQVDRLRGNSATLEDVSRPAKDGDVLTIDLGMTPEEMTPEGEVKPGEPSNVTDISYTVGSGEFGIAELDVQLQGARTGDIIKFTTEVTAERTMSFQVLVKAVREPVLPELTDAWVDEETEFETVEELRNDLRTNIAARKRLQSTFQLRERAMSALVELVTDDAPPPLVETELERRLHDLGHRLEAQGASFERYLSAIGQEPEAFVEEMRASATTSVKADLALRALADAEEIEASEEDVDNEIARLAESVGQSAAQVRTNLVTSDQLPAVRSDVRKTKALAWLMEHVDVVDSEGQPIDRATLELEPAPVDAETAETDETAQPQETNA